MNHKEVFQCRHPNESKIFGFAAIVTILLLIGIFAGAFFRTEIINEVKTEMIATYKKENPSDKNLTETEIVKKLSKDDKDTLKMLENYYHWFTVPLIPVAFFLLVLFIIGKRYGKLIGNSVRLNEHQYPEIYKMYSDMAKELGFEKVPELFLVNGNGLLNAYATCVPGYRNFAAIYSDMFERCIANNDMKSLKFILGHELGHIRLNHVKWWYSFFTFWTNLPVIKYFIGLPLSRSRELGCDQVGKKLSDDNSGKALMMLSAGKHNYQDIDIEEYTKEHFDKPSFWAWVSNLTNDHGLLSWRISAIRRNHIAGLIFRSKADNRSK